jgi:UDP-N-acetylmuramoyl-tripeptide--D-alanyl-D-alanine ligase
VENVLATLQQLAAYHRLCSGIPVLAITGSNGKTTTRELCKAVLSRKFSVFATEGNLNNHIGVPLTLLSMDDSVGLGIVEMGANHQGEIACLCEIAKPDIGLITNIGKAHLEGFGSIRGVAKAKGELFNFLMQHGKTVMVNEGNSYVCGLVPADYPHIIWYNGKRGPEAKSIKSDPYVTLQTKLGHEMVDINTNLLGTYNAENILAAVCVGLHLGIDPKAIAGAIQNYKPQNNRSQLIDTGRNWIFMDAYNANPSSMTIAISEFLRLNGHRKLLILGEMLELGEFSRREHEHLVEELMKQGIQQVICIGKAFEQAALHAGYRYAETTGQLYEWLSENPVRDHFVFIKGSRGNRLERVIPLL